MATFGFLSAPLKSTNEVDLVKPLTTYIDSVYNTSDNNRADVAEAVQELNKLRSKACCQPLDKHQSALDVLTRYYDQLVAIESKIIISATQNPVIFKWKDAFDKGSLFSSRASLSLSDGSFERAAVLFNIGSLMSQIAASQQFHTDDEIKVSAKLFQQSAGVFARLRDVVLGMVQQEPTPDLMPDTLAALSALMVAQAQEAIYIKGHKDKMKAASMVKISAQVAEFYAEAQKMMTKDVVRGLWDKEWSSVVSGKTLAYQALSQFHQAEVNGEARQIGEQLSRLAESLKIFETTQKYLPKDITGIWDIYPTISKAYAAAKKDNDFIYHEKVADFRSLPALPKAPLAKPTPVVNPMTPNFRDMFSLLVPVQVHNAMQSYDARKAELVNMETVRMREATQLMNGVLASLNLPAALDDVTSTETLPESIKMKSAKLKQNGGGAEIMRLFSELPTLYQRNEDILTETSRILNEEKESDDNMRKQLGTKWSRMSSDQLTGPLVTEIGKYRGILHTASNADKMVKEKFESHRQGIELLSKNESELRASIPGQTAHATGETDTVRHLRQLMSEWNEVTTDRELLEKELKNTNCDIANDFLKALAENQLINEEHISKEKIGQIFGGLKQRVQASLDKQEILMNDIQASNNKFTGEKTGSSTGAERERILKMLAQASDAYAELKANLEEGTKFYNDLTPILVRLQQKVSDFAFARQTEKEDLMRQLQLSIVSGQAAKAVVDGVSNLVSSYLTAGTNAAPSPTNAPPRPPPPRPAAPGQSVESPIPPPRTQQSMQATPGAPPQQQQGYNPYQQQPQMQQFQQHPGYYQQQVPYGQPQPQMMFQPQYQPTFAAPYPTFPGAFPSYQQQQWPQQQQQGGFPPNPQFGQQNQQGGGGTNPFQ
ncbi:CBN-ALX-1 protein [Caenorhabditis brenneri]|uniref:CBN-ALX-1 protein n=1 Tax=Caenorhabditis brenneri TaxID=135651 RepID=G0MKF2_CAEBE|nr:CBN-ALX-1 protein [Caenorhabditis brenneri]